MSKCVGKGKRDRQPEKKRDRNRVRENLLPFGNMRQITQCHYATLCLTAVMLYHVELICDVLFCSVVLGCPVVSCVAVC